MEEKSEATSRNDGEIVMDYILGEFKLTMWVPDELGRWIVPSVCAAQTNVRIFFNLQLEESLVRKE